MKDPPSRSQLVFVFPTVKRLEMVATLREPVHQCPKYRATLAAGDGACQKSFHDMQRRNRGTVVLYRPFIWTSWTQGKSKLSRAGPYRSHCQDRNCSIRPVTSPSTASMAFAFRDAFVYIWRRSRKLPTCTSTPDRSVW